MLGDGKMLDRGGSCVSLLDYPERVFLTIASAQVQVTTLQAIRFLLGTGMTK